MKLKEKLAPYRVNKMNKYIVTIIENAFEYILKAPSSEEAEYLAMQLHNSGSYDEVKKVIVEEVKKGG